MKKQNKKKSKKNKKYNRKAVAFLVVIIIITILVMVILLNKKNEKENQNEFINNITTNYGLIDMTNTDNVQISEGKKQNISEKVAADRELEGLKITEIKLIAENGISSFTATVTNNTGKDFIGAIATIQFMNQDGNTFSNLEVILPEVKNGQSNTINAGTTADIANAYDFTITIQKLVDLKIKD